MKTLFCTLLISCLIVANIYANDNESRTFKIISGFCVNNIVGYDFKDVGGYGFGAGFRIGYGININTRLTLESTYTMTFHESDTAGAALFKVNAFDVNLKYVLSPMGIIGLYANIGLGLDLFAINGIDAGYFSYIPNFGGGSYIYLSENFDFDLGFNVNIARFGTGGLERPDGSYLQFLALINIKL